MKKIIYTILIAALSVSTAAQDKQKQTNSDLKLKDNTEKVNNWAINLMFSDNGFGLGVTKFKQLSSSVSGFVGIAFSGAKDDREFEQMDIFGNTYTPYKVNRLFMGMLNIGAQFRLFKDDVTDNLRPYFNAGITPTAIMYTPYDRSFFSSFGYARAKYTVGAFVGIGVDYVSSKHTSLSMNVRGYYINLFGDGVNSLSTAQKNFFGGAYFVFSYNFMH